MQYTIRNKVIIAFLIFCLWLFSLCFMKRSITFFVLWVLLIIVAVIWVFLHRRKSKYINDMKSGKVQTKKYTWEVTKIIPLWIDPSNETYTSRKHVWSRYFEVNVSGNLMVYKSDILEYTGKLIFTVKDFIIYTNKFINIWDKVKVFVSIDKPEFYYLEEIPNHKSRNQK